MKNYKILSVTNEATIHNLYELAVEKNIRFFMLRDRETGKELGSMEINTAADNDLLIANEGMDKPC